MYVKTLIALIGMIFSVSTFAATTQNFDVEVLAALDKARGTDLLAQKADNLIKGQLMSLSFIGLNARIVSYSNQPINSLCHSIGSAGSANSEIAFLVIGGEKHGLFSSKLKKLADRLVGQSSDLSYLCTGVDISSKAGGDRVTVVGNVESKIKQIADTLKDIAADL